MPKIVAITGGIGSGKSVVSNILRIMGYRVYDCDSEAKRITNTSIDIRNAITKKFGKDLFADNILDKKKLASIVFSDKNALLFLNSIIHPAVKSDILNWVKSHDNESMLFIETAILRESNFSDIIDGVIEVTAPKNVRIERVMRRNNITVTDVELRMKRQNNDNIEGAFIINNDNTQPILPQINTFLSLNLGI